MLKNNSWPKAKGLQRHLVSPRSPVETAAEEFHLVQFGKTSGDDTVAKMIDQQCSSADENCTYNM